MAKAARFNAAMDLNLFHLLVEDSDRATVPSDPDLVADEFGWNFVISPCHFHITVTMDTALGFLEAGKERLGQCLQIGPFLLKTSCDLFARCAMDALIGHLTFPTRKKEVFFSQ